MVWHITVLKKLFTSLFYCNFCTFLKTTEVLKKEPDNTKKYH